MPDPLQGGAELPASPEQAHYLRSVLRRQDGDFVRLFDGHHGEFLAVCRMDGKKNLVFKVRDHLRPQPAPRPDLSLVFAPLKKSRQDFLIEKAVELGVTDLYPILTERGEVRTIKAPRIHAHIIEAAEQCERLDLTRLHGLQPLEKCLGARADGRPVAVALARADAPPLLEVMKQDKPPGAFMIGPEGGFTSEEIEGLQSFPHVIPVSLGPQILRAETAALACLAMASQMAAHQN